MSVQGVFLVCRREVDLVRVASATCCLAAWQPAAAPCAGLSIRRDRSPADSSCRP